MMFFWLPIGFALPTICGWLTLRLVEGKHPVLFTWERWVAGFMLGMTLTMIITVFAQVVGLISFTKFGFLTIQVVLFLILEGVYILRRKKIAAPNPKPSPFPKLQRWKKIALGAIAAWIGMKILTGVLLLTTTPVYFDDVFNNWNMRGKIFYDSKELTLVMEAGNEILSVGGVSSYPPTVPLVKTWLSTLAGKWHDGLVASPHILWYLAVLILTYFFLRRRTSVWMTLLGVYALASLPLYLIHGSTPYADVFLSGHILLALLFPFTAANTSDRDQRRTFYKLGAVAAGMLIFTKNEALLLHLPPILLVTGLSLLWSLQQKKMTFREILSIGVWYAGWIGSIAIPWVMFKWIHGLPFGNAKGLPHISEFTWQEGVLYAISINTFFEGNWIFLFAFLIALLIAAWRKAFRTSAVMLTAFLMIVYGMQMPIYLFTGISTEALQQTGYARGLIHLVPIVIILSTLLLEDFLKRKKIIAGDQ